MEDVVEVPMEDVVEVPMDEAGVEAESNAVSAGNNHYVINPEEEEAGSGSWTMLIKSLCLQLWPLYPWHAARRPSRQTSSSWPWA
jgi:hypothetical protein